MFKLAGLKTRLGCGTLIFSVVEGQLLVLYLRSTEAGSGVGVSRSRLALRSRESTLRLKRLGSRGDCNQQQINQQHIQRIIMEGAWKEHGRILGSGSRLWDWKRRSCATCGCDS